MMCEAREALQERTRAAEALAGACMASLEPLAAAWAPIVGEPVPRSLRRLAALADRRLVGH